jgi:hypothetical protein
MRGRTQPFSGGRYFALPALHIERLLYAKMHYITAGQSASADVATRVKASTWSFARIIKLQER